MPEKGPFSLVTSDRHIRRRVGDLEAVVTAKLREPYRAEVQADGSTLLVLERSAHIGISSSRITRAKHYVSYGGCAACKCCAVHDLLVARPGLLRELGGCCVVVD